jgi:phage-related protein (TIGR01555 family)
MGIGKALSQRFDSWVNTLTGLGDVSRDKTLQYTPQLDQPLDTTTLQALINGDDIVYRIVTALPMKALKDGFSFEAVQEGELAPGQQQDDLSALDAACNAMNVRGKVLEAAAWGRGYGLGGVYLGVEGAGQPEEELDDEAGGELKFLKVMDRRDFIPMSYYDDPTSAKFGDVELYRITTNSQTASQDIVVHETRIIRFGGALTSRRDRINNQGCDYSVLQRLYGVIRQAQGNWASACALMADMSQGVYKIRGLMDMIADGNEATLQTRMTLIDSVRSVTRSVLLDADGEDFERKGTPMAGVNELLEQTWKRVASAAEMPMTVLMGTSPAGLNATGESDMRLWYDSIQAYREGTLGPAIERIARYLARDLDQSLPESWSIVWPSLWRMTAVEEATYRMQVAQADASYIDKGVLLAEEVALARFASGAFNGTSTPIAIKARVASLALATKKMSEPKSEPDPLQIDPAGTPKQLAAPSKEPTNATPAR